MVRYETGERFDLHHDWYDTPQQVRDGSGRMFNRIASFFVYLEDECEEGETWFPYIEGTVDGKGKWRKHEDGGLAFSPRTGSALFWVNLHNNRTGDTRVMHAGLPLTSGRKTAMNIWRLTSQSEISISRRDILCGLTAVFLDAEHQKSWHRGSLNRYPRG